MTLPQFVSDCSPFSLLSSVGRRQRGCISTKSSRKWRLRWPCLRLRLQRRRRPQTVPPPLLRQPSNTAHSACCTHHPHTGMAPDMQLPQLSNLWWMANILVSKGFFPAMKMVKTIMMTKEVWIWSRVVGKKLCWLLLAFIMDCRVVLNLVLRKCSYVFTVVFFEVNYKKTDNYGMVNFSAIRIQVMRSSRRTIPLWACHCQQQLWKHRQLRPKSSSYQ